MSWPEQASSAREGARRGYTSGFASRGAMSPEAAAMSRRRCFYAVLGVERDANIWLDRDGQAAAAGGLSTTLRDAARFAEMLRNEGRYNGRQIVPKAVMASLRSSTGANPASST
jgi:CubicO group peptidase (beta-lactamase class C family)